MKKMKLFLSILLTALMIFLLCACGGGNQQQTTAALETTAAVTEAPTEAATEAVTEAPTESPTEEPTEAAAEAPTEAPTEEATEVPSENVTEAAAEEAPKTGEGAELLTNLLNSLDISKGIHFNYNLKTDYMDSDQDIDAHAKDENFYSATKTKAMGLENTTVTFYQDGKAYSLFPKDQTGMLVMNDVPTSLFGGNIMVLDNLFNAIYTQASVKDYTVESSEIEGQTYTAIVYPATEYTADRTFYFDENGQLAYFKEGPPVIDVGIDIGESFYTIKAIDDQVDESLFDISGYTIEEF